MYLIDKNKFFQIHDAFKSLLTSKIKNFIEVLKKNKRKWLDSGDYSVYTGQAGIACTLYHYGKYYNDSENTNVIIKFQHAFNLKLDVILI